MTQSAEAIPQFSKNVVRLTKGEKTYYIVGTAHISSKSVEEVKDVIDAVKPDTVCVELCETRFKALTDDDHWKNLNIVDVFRQGKALMLLASLVLSSFQRRMGAQMGNTPGAEFLESVEKAKELDANLVLADRDIRTTLRRTWSNLSFWRKLTVMGGLFESLFSKEEMTEEQLEEMKESDQVKEMMADLAKNMPEVKTPLIDERDQYLISKIEEAEGNTIVGVVGLGHVNGMIKHFKTPVDRQALDQIPPPSRVTQVLKWLVPILVLALFTKGYIDHRNDAITDMLFAWILPNSLMAGLFTLIGRARLRTTLATMLAAPITSLNPALGAGMVAGLVEGYLRKPTVADCEDIPNAIQSIKGFYANRFTRALLIFFLANLGSALGTIIGVYWLVSLFN